MLILQVIGTAQVFLEPFLFTGGRPGQLDHHRPAADLPLRVPEQPRRRLRRGDRAERHARDRARRACSSCTSGSPTVEQQLMRATVRDAATERCRATPTAASSSSFDRRKRSVRHAMRGRAHVPVRRARPRRARADPLAREGGGHPDPGHPPHAARALAERDRLGEPRARRGSESRSTSTSSTRSSSRSARGSCSCWSRRPAGTCCRCCARGTRRS